MMKHIIISRIGVPTIGGSTFRAALLVAALVLGHAASSVAQTSSGGSDFAVEETPSGDHEPEVGAVGPTPQPAEMSLGGAVSGAAMPPGEGEGASSSGERLAGVTDSGGAAVTLSQLLAHAEANAPEVRVAIARTRLGDADVEGVSILLQDNPEVEVGLGGRTVGSSTSFEAEASVRQRFEIAGERRLRIETAERAREVARARLEQARWAVHAEVHGLYDEALVAREQVRAAERVVSFAEDLARIAERRIAAGEDSPLTRLVARAELSLARARLVDARRREVAARARLAEVAGWTGDGLPRPTGELPPVRRLRAIDEVTRLASEHHPLFRLRDLAVSAAESRVRLEDREAWPEPTLGFDYSHEGETGLAADVWVFSLGLPIPFWNRNQGARARARAELGVVRTEREALNATWLGRIRRVANDVNAAAERVDIYGADVLPAVARNLALILRAYDLGEVEIDVVSQTRERVLETQARAIEALAAYFSALAELEWLLGTEADEALLEVNR